MNPYEYFPSAQRCLHDEISKQIIESPKILKEALATLERWLKGGHEAEERLHEWKALIESSLETEAGQQQLIDLLQDQGEAAVYLKSFSPFAGLLSIDRRREILFHEH